jgi:hypothetical protein
LLEQAVHVSVETPREKHTTRELIVASEKVRGLLTDEEVDTPFCRPSSFGRPIDFE